MYFCRKVTWIWKIITSNETRPKHQMCVRCMLSDIWHCLRSESDKFRWFLKFNFLNTFFSLKFPEINEVCIKVKCDKCSAIVVYWYALMANENDQWAHDLLPTVRGCKIRVFVRSQNFIMILRSSLSVVSVRMIGGVERFQIDEIRGWISMRQ